MARFIIFLNSLINLYLYFVVGASLMSLVPNINPDYPLFHYIFTAAGFYILDQPFIFPPMIIMMGCVLVQIALRKIYDKYYKSNEPKVVILTPEELIEKLKEQKEKDIKNDSDKDNRSDS